MRCSVQRFSVAAEALYAGGLLKQITVDEYLALTHKSGLYFLTGYDDSKFEALEAAVADSTDNACVLWFDFRDQQLLSNVESEEMSIDEVFDFIGLHSASSKEFVGAASSKCDGASQLLKVLDF